MPVYEYSCDDCGHKFDIFGANYQYNKPALFIKLPCKIDKSPLFLSLS